MPFDEIEGEDDLERAERLVQKAIEVRGVKLKITEVPVPVAYGSAFEGEVVRRADMQVEFGGRRSRAFEYLLHADRWTRSTTATSRSSALTSTPSKRAAAWTWASWSRSPGARCKKTLSPCWSARSTTLSTALPASSTSASATSPGSASPRRRVGKGFGLKHFGSILHARFHADFGAIVDKVQVKIITDPALHAEWLDKAREAYDYRNRRLADMTDESVDTFYSCILCQSFAPDHVCIISPERLGLCGAYNWLDCKASYEINPTGPNQPIIKGDPGRRHDRLLQRAPTSTPCRPPTAPCRASPSTRS